MESVEDVENDSRHCRPTFLSHFNRSAGDERSFLVLLDHCYAKPWSELADSLCPRAKPACLLFMSRYNNSAEREAHSYGDIDIESVDSSKVLPYDQEKARLLMTECERNVNFARIEEIADEAWEEKVNREGWSATQTRLFNRIVKALHSDRLARLAFAGHANEPVLRRICIDKTSKRVRQALAGAAWDPMLTRWLHSTLTSVLGQSALSAYLDVLQTVSSKAPNQVAVMMGWNNETSNDKPTAEALKLLLKRPWDPVASFLSIHQLSQLPREPLLVLVPDVPADLPRSPASLKRYKLWTSQLSALGKVIQVVVDNSMSAMQFVAKVESTVLAKCSELQDRYPQRPIILIGWQIGGVIACRLSCSVSVAAIVSLGFPTEFLRGSLNDAEEMLAETSTPVLFIVGQNATTCCVDDLEDMREQMPAESSLVIVGGSDDRIRMSHGRRRSEGITQSMLDRCILDKIGEFLNDILSKDPTAPGISVNDEAAHASETQIKNIKIVVPSSRSSNLFDPLAGGDAQALLMQPSDSQLHQRPLKRHREVKKRRNRRHISEVLGTEDSSPSVLGRQLMLTSSVTRNPIRFTQSMSHDGMSRVYKQWNNSAQIHGAATSALQERLKTPSALSMSLNMSVGSLSSSLAASRASQIQQLLVNSSVRPAFHQVPLNDTERYWTSTAPSTVTVSSSGMMHCEHADFIM